MFDPFEQILFVCDQLKNTSVFAKILEGLSAFGAVFLFELLFFVTTGLADGMLVFTNHDGYSIVFVVRVLAGNACESGIIHKDDIINSVLFAGFGLVDI